MRQIAKSLFLLFVATVMGAAVMAVEVLGTRVIGTLYGSSLYVWGALISVTLVSLAVGYFVGGLVADSAPRAWLLYGILMLGGLATLAVPHFRQWMLPCYRRFGLRGGALASAALLFFVPLLLLGMTGPFVIRLLSRTVSTSGRTAGGVYALSTVGSVAGTLAISFFIIPSTGSPVAMRLVGGAIVGVAALGLVVEQGLRLLPLVLLAALGVPGPAFRRERRIPLEDAEGDGLAIIYRDESAYSRLAVLQSADERMLLADGILQTGIPWGHYPLERARLLVEEGYYLELLPYLVDRPRGKQVLVIGLAGGLLPRLLQLHGMEPLAVEIDPKMAQIARRFFRYDGPLVVQDGRRFVEDTDRRFHACAIDAYSSDVLPFHLVSREMFEAVHQVLAPEGILAINLITAPQGRVAASVYRTLKSVFPAVWAYRSGEGHEVQPVFFFAAAEEPPVSRAWMFDVPSDQGVPRLPYDLGRRRLDFDPARGRVLTDDFNPIDLVRAPEALAWRRKTIEALGLEAVLY
ncbi:MAG: fused MFS/spermidine synthase [Candidatus Brocadiia bacterium]